MIILHGRCQISNLPSVFKVNTPERIEVDLKISVR